ncbi:hypothetical protein VTP01DRAFT_443 [Rhizomucor pusillus]|uniref:uncharacterized protein n=1 Tax=Rhizomucor pusillus TaxID=4840 RepID=UPI003742C240
MADNGGLQLQDPVPEEQIDVCAKDWIQEQIDKERNRIRSTGALVIPLKLINCGVVPNFDERKARAVNRLELDTQFDLKKVQQVMVSPGIPYPHKPGFQYVNLILVTDKPIPFLAPYLYKLDVKVIQPEKDLRDDRKLPSQEVTLKNDLREFLFINKKGIRGRFTIKEYHDV